MTVMAIWVEMHHLLSVHSKNPSWYVWKFAFRLRIGYWYSAYPNILKSERLGGLGIRAMHSS
jgi:hypothetical protein